MPIQVKDYTWEETEETVLISVPLKGVPSNRVDIFSVDDYIKVCFNSDDVPLTYAGREQSMEIDDRKINRSIDNNQLIIVHWHQLALVNR